MGRLLILGAGLAATMQALILQPLVIGAASSPLVGSLALMAVAFVSSLCSEADAFVAVSFTPFPLGSQLGFLSLAPSGFEALLSIRGRLSIVDAGVSGGPGHTGDSRRVSVVRGAGGVRAPGARMLRLLLLRDLGVVLSLAAGERGDVPIYRPENPPGRPPLGCDPRAVRLGSGSGSPKCLYPGAPRSQRVRGALIVSRPPRAGRPHTEAHAWLGGGRKENHKQPG
jgi:hypothetical protein